MGHIRVETGPGLVLELNAIPAISYVAYHCEMPAVSRVSVTNHSPEPSVPFALSFHIPGFSSPCRRMVGVLASGATMPLGSCLNLDPRDGALLDLRRISGRACSLEIRIDDHLMRTEAIPLAGPDEWPLDDCFRKALACFVLPASARVQDIVSRAFCRLSRSGLDYSCCDLLAGGLGVKLQVIRAVYEAVGNLVVHYDLEPPPGLEGFQRIRTPEEILAASRASSGRGTCIDLALLLASCLENFHLQPVIVFHGTGEKNVDHALLGCWTYSTLRYEPIITDFSRIENALSRDLMVLVEATGLTTSRRLPFEKALESSREGLSPASFRFALDVAAARRSNIYPMQFPMNPACLAFLRKGEHLAQQQKCTEVTPGHLLTAMVQGDSDGGILSRILLEAGARLDWADAAHEAEGLFVAPRHSIHYRRCLADAVNAAGRAKLVREEHLLYGILLSGSPEVDPMLRRLGTSVPKVLAALRSTLAAEGPGADSAILAHLRRENRFPVPAVRAIVTREDGRVLVLRRKPKQQYAGKWCLPGGLVEYGETVAEAAVRELAEETSLACTAVEVLFYQDSPPNEPNGMHCINFYVKCDVEGMPQPGEEAEDLAWIGPEELRGHHYRLVFRNDTGLELYWRKSSS